MASINIGQLVATTLRNRRDELVDNMSDNVPFYNRLRKKNKMTLDGGRDIVIPLEYAENGSFQFYSGYETLNISVNDFIDAAVYDWKQASIAVSISGLEQIRNSGRHAVIKLLSSKINNARKTYVNQMGAQVHADGTGSGGKEIGGLGLLVPTTVTNQVGGIDANTYTFWRSVILDATTYNGGATTAANIQDWMQNLYIQLTRNGDKPDLGLFSNVYYQMYWKSLTGIQRISGTSEGRAGFDTLKFVNMDCVLEGGIGGNMNDANLIAGATAFFLNTDYLSFVTHTDRDMEVVGGDRQSLNQDATVQLQLWAGNMTCSNRMLQGKVKE
jgi:hypothetical protein